MGEVPDPCKEASNAARYSWDKYNTLKRDGTLLERSKQHMAAAILSLRVWQHQRLSYIVAISFLWIT